MKNLTLTFLHSFTQLLILVNRTEEDVNTTAEEMAQSIAAGVTLVLNLKATFTTAQVSLPCDYSVTETT